MGRRGENDGEAGEGEVYLFVCVEEGNIVIKIGDWIPEGVSGAIVPDLGAVRRTLENLRGYYFAKSEEGGGQTHCVQTVSSPFFNAKSYPLRFSTFQN